MNRRQLHRVAAAIALGLAARGALADDGGPASRWFTSTNSPAGNEVLVIGDGPSGTLALLARHPTQGTGTGAGLGSQGAVTLSQDGRWLFVVNAGSHTLSTFAVRPAGLVLASVQDSGGLQPVSVSERGGLVYVVNAGGSGNVAGFRNEGGRLVPVAGSVQPLSAAGSGPGQVGIAPGAGLLLVTERATNLLATYALQADGSAGAPVLTASSGPTPFGFAFDRRGHAYVSEAFGGATDASALSSYRFDGTQPRVLSASVPTLQTAACWVVLSPDGRFAYVANAGSGSLSSYAIAVDGRATLLQSVAASTGPNSGPVDMAVPRGGRTLAVLAARAQTLLRYTREADGSLVPAGSASGLPAGLAGLAAR